MSEPIVNEPTTEAPTSTEPKPISLSESGNPVEANTPSVAQTHQPIPTGPDSSQSAADKPQIISSPALPDVKIPQDPKHVVIPPYTGDIQTMNSHGTEEEAKELLAKIQTQTQVNNIPAPTPETTFAETKAPPAETTIAPEVPSAPASTPGFMDKVMKIFGRNKS